MCRRKTLAGADGENVSHRQASHDLLEKRGRKSPAVAVCTIRAQVAATSAAMTPAAEPPASARSPLLLDSITLAPASLIRRPFPYTVPRSCTQLFFYSLVAQRSQEKREKSERWAKNSLKGFECQVRFAAAVLAPFARISLRCYNSRALPLLSVSLPARTTSLGTTEFG